MKKSREAPFGYESKTKELNEILRFYHFRSDFLRDQLFARAKQNAPNRENDAIVAVAFAAQRRVMRPMKRRRYYCVG